MDLKNDNKIESTLVSGIQKKQTVRLPRQTHPYKKNVPPVPKLKGNFFKWIVGVISSDMLDSQLYPFNDFSAV